MILVAGIGNIFLGDDGFGSEVARRLGERPQPEDVHVVDFGIRGVDLLYALLREYAAVIIVDATQRGGKPGAVYVIEPDIPDASPGAVETHSMDPERVLALARQMGAELRNVTIVGCEPATFECADDGSIGLSPPVQSAMDRVIAIVESLIQEVHA